MKISFQKSIGAKLILLLFIFSLILGLSISIFSFYSSRLNYIQFFSKKTQETVRFSSTLIDGDKIKDYVNTQTKDDYYFETLNMLNNMKRDTGLMYLYIFVPDKTNFTYIMEAKIESDNPEKIASLGDIYEYKEIEYKYLLPDVEAKKSSTEIILGGDSFFGETVSAWSPIFDSKGNVVAMIEADASLSMVESLLYKYVILVISLIGILIFISVILLYYFSKKIIINPINILTKKVKLFVSGDKLGLFENDIHTKDELQLLSESFFNMSVDLHTFIKNLKETTEAKQKIESELHVARSIQASMLPRIFPPFPNRKDIEIYASMEPAKEVGGDLYDFFLISENKLCFVVGDVSGKGVPASLFMVIAKTLIKNEALRGISPEEIFNNVNKTLSEQNDECLFVTVFLGILDLDTGVLEFSNAGHNPPLINRANEKEFSYLELPKGFVLAGMPGMKFKKAEIRLNYGDTLFIYTDGVTEAMNINGNLYSEKRLETTLSELNEDDRSAELIIKEVRKDIATHVLDAEQSDDITMLSIRYKGNE